ncbi:MAG: hypothetical protein AAFQ82_27080, partial [Myxococcota bacterium]
MFAPGLHTTEWLTEIGGYRFHASVEQLPSGGLDFDVPHLWRFLTAPDDAPSIPVDVSFGRVSAPRRKPDCSHGRAWAAYRDDEALEFILQGRLPRPCCSMRWSDRSRFSIRFDPELAVGERPYIPFRYPLDSIALKLMMNDGIVLHASSVVIDGGAHVFVGMSGAGKTTIARLLQGRGEILSDERVVIR